MLTPDELNDRMLKDLAELARLRVLRESLSVQHNALYDAWKAQNAPLLAEMGQVVQDVDCKEKAVREAGKELYERTMVKKLAGGVGIRVMERMKYSPEEAFRWALDHKDCLKLDKAQFDAIAKVREDLPFVTKEEVVTVTIPTEINLTGAQVLTAPVPGGGGESCPPGTEQPITGEPSRNGAPVLEPHPIKSLQREPAAGAPPTEKPEVVA